MLSGVFAVLSGLVSNDKLLFFVAAKFYFDVEVILAMPAVIVPLVGIDCKLVAAAMRDLVRGGLYLSGAFVI